VGFESRFETGPLIGDPNPWKKVRGLKGLDEQPAAAAATSLLEVPLCGLIEFRLYFFRASTVTSTRVRTRARPWLRICTVN
jgi:hypothetical protein